MIFDSREAPTGFVETCLTYRGGGPGPQSVAGGGLHRRPTPAEKAGAPVAMEAAGAAWDGQMSQIDVFVLLTRQYEHGMLGLLGGYFSCDCICKGVPVGSYEETSRIIVSCHHEGC